MRYIIILLTSALTIIGYGQSLITVKGQTGTMESYEDIFISLNGGCSLSCGIGWTLSATSTLKSQVANSYEPRNMDDGQKETAWVEGAADYGIGERIIVKFEGDASSKNIPFRAIQITNGYAKDLETWKNNSSVKLLKLRINGNDKLVIELADSIYPQYVELGKEILLSNGDIITLEIIDVYKGNKYSDTAISDFSLDGAH